MVHFRTLGTIDVRTTERGEVRSLLSQPKRLALLAYLALAVPRGPHRRDTVLALFWPEQDAEHARNALSQAVHFLRRELGADAFPKGRGFDLGLGWDALWCDAIEFERALDEHRDADALELYRGPLLPGLHIAEAAPELEEWLDDRRRRLAGRWAETLERVAVQREAASDHAGAAIWWRQLAAHDPLSSRFALRLMRALAAAGDHGSAIRHARVHELQLHEAVGAPPDPRVSAFVKNLQSRQPAAPPERGSVAPVLSPRAQTATVADAIAAGGSNDAAGPPAMPRRVAVRQRRLVVAGVLAAIAATASLANHAKPGRAPTRPVASPPSSLSVRRGDSAAAELYVRARYAWRSRNPASIRQAILLYRQAIARDSAFALAYAGLADAYRFYGGLNFGPVAPYMDSARVMVRHAIALDSALSQAHTTLASLLTDSADWTGAEREYRRAIALDPDNALAHHWYALMLATVDRRDEALREIHRARVLDSLSGPLNRAVSQIETWAEVRDPTFATPERRPIVDPAFKGDHYDRALYHALQGLCTVAAAEIRQAYELSPNDAMVDAANVGVHLRCGDRLGARAVLRRMKRRDDARLSTVYIAMAHTELGEPDSAFAWLDREEYWGMVKRFELRTSVYMIPLRSDPRYPQLLARVGMQPGATEK